MLELNNVLDIEKYLDTEHVFYSAFCRSALVLIQYDSKKKLRSKYVGQGYSLLRWRESDKPSFLVVHMIYFFGCRKEHKF